MPIRVYSAKHMPTVLDGPVLRDIPLSASFALAGKAGFFHSEDGTKLAGIADHESTDGRICVKLAVPNEDGILLVSDGTALIRRDDFTVFDGIQKEAKIRAFESNAAASIDTGYKMLRRAADGKMYTSIKDEDENYIEDYQDVSITGLASTFKDTTPADRDGEYIMPGAFNKTLLNFKRNPVMLTDHTNKCCNVAGSFTKVSSNPQGLAVEAKVTNAPGMRDVRFAIVEGHLKSFSIGGFFFYNDQDYRGVEEVELFEISLIPIPANPDALFQVRQISLDQVQKAYKMLQARNKLKFTRR